jgi:predicted N-acetyltransferase YhbS
MTIEPLANHPEKIHALAQMLHDEWKAFAPWTTRALIVDRLKSASTSQQFPYTFIALSADDQLLGSASIKIRELPEEADKIYWLGEVLIRKQSRGQGIGSALIRACIDHTFNRVDTSLYLYTPDQQELYKKFGWVHIDEKLINGEKVTIMQLSKLT